MTRYFALTLTADRSAPSAAAEPRREIKPRKRLGFRFFGLLIGLGVFYLALVNNISTKGYAIEKLQQRLTELQESQERLEIEAASLQAIGSIEETTKQLNLIPADSVNHLGQGGNFSYQP